MCACALEGTGDRTACALCPVPYAHNPAQPGSSAVFVLTGEFWVSGPVSASVCVHPVLHGSDQKPAILWVEKVSLSSECHLQEMGRIAIL